MRHAAPILVLCALFASSAVLAANKGVSPVPAPRIAQKSLIDTPVVSLACPTYGYPYCLGIRVPARIDPRTRYPLIIYLHGGVGANRNDKGSRAWEMFSFIADSIPIFLASPSADRASAWWTPAGTARIAQTLAFMKDRYPIDHDRIILAGVSDGATGCFFAASTMPGPFAGFIPISGYGWMLTQMGIPLSLDSLRTRPFRIINGGRDALYPLAATRQFAEALERAGVPLTFKVYPDAIHGFDYRFEERDAILRVISQWRRPRAAPSTPKPPSSHP